jgi:hypothetical protein
VNGAHRRWRVWLWLLAGVLTLGGGGYAGLNSFTTWRALRMSAEALQLIADGTGEAQWRQAYERSRAAYGLRPQRLEVVRATARVHDRLAPDRAPPFWEQAVELGENQLGDLLGLFAARLTLGETRPAAAVLAILEVAFPGEPEIPAAQARLALADGRLGDALAAGRELAAHPGATAEHQFLYVQITQVSPDPLVVRSGIDHLFQMIEGADMTALKAARNLARFTELEAAGRARLIERLDALAEDRRDQLLALHLRLAQPDADRRAIAQAARRLFRLAEAAETGELARWYNQSGLYEATLELLPEADALRRQDYFLLRADAMAMAGQWTALQRLLEQMTVPLDNYLIQVFRMRTHWETGEFRRARIEWERALLDAGRDADKLWFMERYARTLGLAGYREEALAHLVRIPLAARRAYLDLLRLLESQGRTAEVRDRLDEMHKLFPEDDAVRNDRAYFNLLLGQRTDEATAEAALLVERNPNLLAPRMTLALAQLQAGKADEARAQLRALTVDWDQVSDRWRLLVACILAASGERRWGERYLDSVDRTRLLPEESALVRVSFGGAG